MLSLTLCDGCGDPVELDSTITVADGRDLCSVCIKPFVQCIVCRRYTHYSQVSSENTCVACLDTFSNSTGKLQDQVPA